MQPLFEKHRPGTFAEVVGQDKAIKTLILHHDRGGFLSRAYWLSGASGTGKTTLARCIATQATANEHDITEIDAAELTPATARDLLRGLNTYGLGGKGRALIVNEAHYLPKQTFSTLLTATEPLPSNGVLIFTTTCDGMETLSAHGDFAPLLSRCTEIELARRDLAKPFAERAADIAIAAGLADPAATREELIARCVRLAKDERNNLRRMLSKIDAGILLAD